MKFSRYKMLCSPIAQYWSYIYMLQNDLQEGLPSRFFLHRGGIKGSKNVRIVFLLEGARNSFTSRFLEGLGAVPRKMVCSHLRAGYGYDSYGKNRLKSCCVAWVRKTSL
jgi:hypothetical protein